MERVFAWIIIIHYDFHNVVLIEDECIRVGAVDGDVRGRDTSGKNAIQSRNLWPDIRYAVEESTGRYINIDY